MATITSEPVLREGSTCWRIATADRFALIVDASDYFARLKAAMLEARNVIYLIGWDFDTRIHLEPGSSDDEVPDTLGRFLNALVKRTPGLKILLLKWDLGVIQTLGRGATPLFLLDWMAGERVRLKLDGAHPVGGCHHQKIAVIDDALAFCGGIDITVGRWDTREHRDDDPRRRSPWGFAQPPWHDATAAVNGDVAAALGDLARERWKAATGETLDKPEPREPFWLDGLDPLLRDIPVGIARTRPAHDGAEEVREIETFYVEAIQRARHSIYVETQYLASHIVCDALAAQLARPDGPEIVILNPESAEGWLEEEVMGTARSLVVERLRKSDAHGRFRLYFPVTAGGEPIYVHAKIMIVDDVLLRVGSSNLNNRSMGVDTECDLVIEAEAEAGPEDPVRAAISGVRSDLLAEHLGASVAAVDEAFARTPSLIGVIDSLNGTAGKRLRRLEPPCLSDIERTLAEARLLDPERPTSLARCARRLRRHWRKRQ